MTSYDGQAITYDQIGNPLTYRDGMNFTWAGRQLATATVNGESISYTYNSDGIRTSKTVDGVTTDYLVDGSTIVAQNTVYDTLWFLYDSDGTRAGFTYHDDAYYYMKNAQGDVTGIVDSDLNVVVEYSYDAWGKLIDTTGSEADFIGKLNPFLYRGYYYDAETGLYYLGTRYYDAQTGRFLNSDGNIDLENSLTNINLFTYCGNNPVNRIDHTGHSWFNVLIVAAVVTVAAVAVFAAAPALAAAAVAVGIGSITSTAIAATAYTVGTMAVGVGFFATGQIAVQTAPKSFRKTKSESKSKVTIKAQPKTEDRQKAKYYSAKVTHPGAEVYIDQPLSLELAKTKLALGADIWAVDSESAKVLCTATGGGYTGPTRDGNPLNAMHYHPISYIGRGHVFFGNDPNLNFIRIFD